MTGLSLEAKTTRSISGTCKQGRLCRSWRVTKVRDAVYRFNRLSNLSPMSVDVVVAVAVRGALSLVSFLYLIMIFALYLDASNTKYDCYGVYREGSYDSHLVRP